MNIDISMLDDKQIALVHEMVTKAQQRREIPQVVLDIVIDANIRQFKANWHNRPEDATMMSADGTTFYKHMCQDTSKGTLVRWNVVMWEQMTAAERKVGLNTVCITLFQGGNKK